MPSYAEMLKLWEEDPNDARLQLWFLLTHLNSCESCRRKTDEVNEHVRLDYERGKGMFKGA